MAELIRSYENATSGAMKASGSLPVRLYTTGTNHKRVIRATGGEDANIIGFAKAGVVTAGYGVAVLEDGEFLGKTSTTVAAGDKVKIGAGATYIKALTAGTRYCAKVLKARTNTGYTWLKAVPGGSA